MKKKTRNIFFLFGIAAIILMILTFKVSFAEMWHDIQHTGYWIFAILGMWMFLYWMNTLTWKTIILGSGDCTIPFWKLYKVTISGFALNYATPAGLMGGEPYKIMELTPYIGRERATSSVLLFAMMHIFAHFWYWLTAVVLYLIFVPLDFTMTIILPLIAAFSLGGIYLFVRGYKNGMVVKCIRLVSKLPGCKKWGKRFLETHAKELANIDCQIAQLQGQNKKSFYGSFFLEYIGRILQSFEIFFMLRLVAVQGTPLQLFMYSLIILAFTSLFANLLFFMPLQLGGREGGFAMSVTKMKMIGASGALLTLSQAMTIAVFISIICRVREIVWTSIGMLLMKFGTKVKLKGQQ
ncbi:MAG: flippase-like domain-containing protein [Bacteroidaceae bacterium]|nr:flippase-like domain-containing protein [Bacteroidaceae bacterium]